MYSVDCAFADTQDGWQFVTNLAKHIALTNHEMDLFADKNAERLLRL